MASKTIKIELSEKDINKLIDEIEDSNLQEETRNKLIDVLKTFVEVNRLVGLKSATLARLRKVFNKQTEKQHNKDPKDKKEAIGKTGGSGRHGQDEYTGAREITYSLADFKPKDNCPECGQGKLYAWDPGVYIRIHGQAPLDVVIHKTEKLRCNACGLILEADCPVKGQEKFDSQAKAVIATLHYKSSLPFYRLEQLQQKLGLPLPRSTMWVQVESLANRLFVVWKHLVSVASNGKLFFIDDTKAKILSLMLENELQKENKKHRKGMYTTGILSQVNETQIVLYFTGRKYSGENLKDLLDKRECTKPIAVMSDALNHNKVKDFEQEILQYLCLTHGRRQFKDLEEDFQNESSFVIDLIGQVYKNEEHCKTQGLNSHERLQYHKDHSGPPMDQLKKWIDKAFPEKKVEPNSTLGKGIKYIQRHWNGLTAFLRHPGAPLDNNLLEQQFKVPVLNKKNWLFYKNQYGAFIGDIFLSIIKTCDLNEQNVIEYMASIYDNFDRVKESPELWLPWNFKQN